jgi:hypothetical protein
VFPWSGDPEAADADLARIHAQLAVTFDALAGAVRVSRA